MSITYPKRLIEVDLPIRRISEHARREKNIRDGNISTLHIWWARRPLAACRAVLCASLWPDPVDTACPAKFIEVASNEVRQWATGKQHLLSKDSLIRFTKIAKNEKLLKDRLQLRGALLDFIADFSKWENSTEPSFLTTSRMLTLVAQQELSQTPGSETCVVDPFAGGGAIPVEAMRLGTNVFASDLNPLPVILNKTALEYVPRYGKRLVDQVLESGTRIYELLRAELINYYIPENSSANPYTFFWGRTIQCEGPGCGCTFPLIRSLWLKTKGQQLVAIELLPTPDNRSIKTNIVVNPSKTAVKKGTSKLGAAICPMCAYTTPVEHVRAQLTERNGGTNDAQLIAITGTQPGVQGKLYRNPNSDDHKRFQSALDSYQKLKSSSLQNGLTCIPNEPLNHLRGFFNVVLYGMTTWGDLLAPRQALLLHTLSTLIRREMEQLSKTDKDFAAAVGTILALCAGKVSQYNSSCCRWKAKGETLVDMFGRQAIPMVWDYAEAFPFGETTGDFSKYLQTAIDVLNKTHAGTQGSGTAVQASATEHVLADDSVDLFFTDPPYYDAIPYADLSDYFYVWLHRTLRGYQNGLFSEPLSPKKDECVTLSHRAAMYRNKDKVFFEQMMGRAMAEGRRLTKPDGLGVVVFANKSTSGWEAMLSALVNAGWIVTGSWPIDTELGSRLRARNSAVLSSSVHIVCRPRENPDGSLNNIETGDWRDVLHELPVRVSAWMKHLSSEGVVGADAIFACLGPALEIFSRYSKVEKASGELVTLAEYLEHVWATVAKEALNLIFTDADASGFEADARLTAIWLWTLSTSNGTPEAGEEDGNANDDEDEDEDDDVEGEGKSSSKKIKGFPLEYDAARKIAQGLGVHLDQRTNLVKLSGKKAVLLAVADRVNMLFDQDSEKNTPRPKAGSQLKISSILDQTKNDGQDGITSPTYMPKPATTVLDRVHQAMILFGASQGDALKRFLVDDGIGTDQRFWKLAQSLSALYPVSSQEKRWIDGVLSRKKGLGF